MKRRLSWVLFSAVVLSCTFYDVSGEWALFGDLTDAVQAQFPRRVSACGFSVSDTEAIYAAVDFWNDVAGEVILVAEPNGCKDHKYADLLFTPAGFDRDDGAVAAVFLWHCDGYICRDIWALIYDEWWRQDYEYRLHVARHEVGHYLGLGHFSRGCVMGSGEVAEEMCDDELAVFCRHYSNLRGCKRVEDGDAN